MRERLSEGGGTARVPTAGHFLRPITIQALGIKSIPAHPPRGFGLRGEFQPDPAAAHLWPK